MNIRRVWCHRCNYPQDVRNGEKARPCCLCRCSESKPIPPATLWSQPDTWDLMLTGEDRRWLRENGFGSSHLTAPIAKP